MKSFIVYDSKYGNTEALATVIADALKVNGPVVLVSIKDCEPASVEGADLLVVGGPTQVHGVSPAVRSFLEWLPESSLQGVEVAAFDTRLNLARFITGAAAAGIAHTLKHKGGHLIVPPEGFRVMKQEGPLVYGEDKRAAAWAAAIAEKAASRHRTLAAAET